MNDDPFKDYLREVEPEKRYKGYAWQTAIDLQKADRLETSDYLKNTAIRNIEGEISFEEADSLLQNYYRENPTRDPSDRTEEADKVSARIAKILSEKAFSFAPTEYLSIHKKTFHWNLFSCRKNARLQYYKERMGFGWRYCSLWKCN